LRFGDAVEVALGVALILVLIFGVPDGLPRTNSALAHSTETRLAPPPPAVLIDYAANKIDVGEANRMALSPHSAVPAKAPLKVEMR